jgi:hypothetical protein
MDRQRSILQEDEYIALKYLRSELSTEDFGETSLIGLLNLSTRHILDGHSS